MWYMTSVYFDLICGLVQNNNKIKANAKFEK